MHVAIYARVSTQRQTETQTTEQQLDRLRAHAEGQGWSVAADRVFRDDGYSGASLKRPGLDRLRDVAASARLDRILITEPDRLARNFVHQMLLVEELQKHGAEVAFLDRPMSRDPHDQLLLHICGAVAEYERTLIAERMRRGRLRKLRAGTCCRGRGRPKAIGLTPTGHAIPPAFAWIRRRPRWRVICSCGSPTRAKRSMPCNGASTSWGLPRPGDTGPGARRPCTPC